MFVQISGKNIFSRIKRSKWGFYKHFFRNGKISIMKTTSFIFNFFPEIPKLGYSKNCYQNKFSLKFKANCLQKIPEKNSLLFELHTHTHRERILPDNTYTQHCQFDISQQNDSNFINKIPRNRMGNSPIYDNVFVALHGNLIIIIN